MKLEVDYRKKNRKNTNTWGPNNILVKKKKKEERMRKTKPRKTRPFKNEITQSFFKTRHQWERDIVII